MKNIINKVFQVLIDFVVGAAIYFGLKALIPAVGDNSIAIVTLIAAATFAEFVEVKIKK